MTETLVNGYSSESTPRELSNEYQHDRVSMILKDFCILVLSTNVGSALVGLKYLMKSMLGALCSSSLQNIGVGIKSALKARPLMH